MYKNMNNLLNLEKIRQKNSINLIASENYSKFNNLNQKYNFLMDKYAEGYPKKRYYAGCKYIDFIENQAIDYCRKLFKFEYINVQPHSGSQANQAVYMALCETYDKIMGLNLSHGGHITHGNFFNFSGHFYRNVSYKLNDKEYLDYDLINYIVKINKPKIIVAGVSAYSRLLNWKILKKIAFENNAYLLADISHVAGLIATNNYPSPLNYADVVTFTTHKTLRGPKGAVIMTSNKYISFLINKAVFPGIQGGPFMNNIAIKGLAFKSALSKKFENYQKQVILNAKNLAFFLKSKNFNIVSNGTDSHLMLIDLNKFGITGDEAQKRLESVNIIVNKNTVPNDINSANIASGVRLGTAAVTTRGFLTNEMFIIAELIHLVLTNNYNERLVKEQVTNLCKNFDL